MEPHDPTKAPADKALPGLKPLGAPVGSAIAAFEPPAPATPQAAPSTVPRDHTRPVFERAVDKAPRSSGRLKQKAAFVLPFIAFVGMLLLLWQREKPLRFDHEWIVEREPVQTLIEDGGELGWIVGRYTILPTAEYEIEALLLRKRRYRYDSVSDLSPWDFALGWGVMSNADLLDEITMGQGGRFYRYSVPADFPLRLEALNEHSANVHILPSNDVIARIVSRMQPGERIRLRGKLVNVAINGQFGWRSSLRRDDTGAGACEILWVEYAETLAP